METFEYENQEREIRFKFGFVHKTKMSDIF